MSGVPQSIGRRDLAMTIRRIRHGYEVKIPLVPEHLLVLICDSLKEASQLDKVGRLYERIANREACQLAELETALRALKAAGVNTSEPYGRLAACAAELRSKK